MNEFLPEQLLVQIRELDEHPRIEAKRGREIGPSVMQSVCAFANEPGLGGGYLLLGVAEPDEEHDQFWVCGVEHGDQLLNELQINSREQFEQPIPIKGEPVLLEGKRVLVVFVPELEPVAKPCTFKGKFASKNKKKTGVWRRGLNGDYECGQQEIEPLLLTKNGMSFEQVILPDANWDDLDPEMIQLYRQLRAKVKPQAMEIQASDQDMLRALNLVRLNKEGEIKPNIAGLLLLGKSLSLRRLLPAVRVDYVRIAGMRWVENPHQRFEITHDFREPLLRLIPKIEATILDDLPRHFRQDDGHTQRSDTPLLPYKVVREAVVNALMHRDYSIHQPTLVVRFSNRLEIANAGYSLKPEERLGEMGSVLRNPVIAGVLYDLDFAEAKGTGIRTMRQLLTEANLTAPVFCSDVLGNQFTSTYLLHHLLGAEQLAWLGHFSEQGLSDYEAKALLVARALGAVDNAALRYVSGLETLAASQVLSKLHHQRGLLIKGGSGPRTYYQLPPAIDVALNEFTGALDAVRQQLPNTGGLPANASDLGPNASDLDPNTSDLDPNTSDLPEGLQQLICSLSAKARQNTLWPVILWLCHLTPRKAEVIATLLSRREDHLKTNHLSKMRKLGLLSYVYPEVVNHPEQAYVTTEKGKTWLTKQGVEL
jgi:ATP-dependent DNA helicase RecG